MTSKRALIVGINEYQDSDIPTLKGAEKDAEELYKLLVDDGDFKVDEEHFLPGKIATCDAVRSGISDLLWQTDQCDLTLLYFSGHGFQDSYGTGFIAPWDMDPQRPLVRGIDMQQIKRLALNSPSKDAVVLIFDCCYAGVAAAGDKAVGYKAAPDTAEKCFSDIADMDVADDKPTGLFVFSSSAEDETSRELTACEHKLGGGDPPHPHGAFTFHLLEGLSGDAINSDPNLVSVDDLDTYLDDVLKKIPNQTYKGYSAGATNKAGIILARASNMKEFIKTLKGIEENMKSGELEHQIFAAINFVPVRRRWPKHPSVKKLEERLESDLAACKSTVLAWCVANRMQIYQQAMKPARDLEQVVHNLSLGRIEKEPGSTHGLLLTLANLVAQNGPPETLINELLAGTSRLNVETRGLRRGKPP